MILVLMTILFVTLTRTEIVHYDECANYTYDVGNRSIFISSFSSNYSKISVSFRNMNYKHS